MAKTEIKKTMFPEKFIKWKDKNTAIIFIRNGKWGYWIAYEGMYYSLSEMYYWWLENVKNKEK